MDRSNFSDILSNRYKELLKKSENAEKSSSTDSPDNQAHPSDNLPRQGDILRPTSDGFNMATPLKNNSQNVILGTAGAKIEHTDTVLPRQTLKKSVWESENDTPSISIDDKLKLFTDRISSSEFYPSNQELINKLGFTHDDFAVLSDYKYKLMIDPAVDIYEKISLQSEGGRHFFYKKDYAVNKLTNMFNTYIDQQSHFKAESFIDDMLHNMIYSETQYTLDLEPETNPKKHIENALSKNEPLSPVEQLLSNIYDSYAYIISNEMSEEALYELHKIVTKNMPVRSVRRYRTEEMTISGNLGDVALKAVSPPHIELFIKKLFTYIDFSMSNSNAAEAFVSSFIIHYYFIYISPYFEYNFILARLVASWYVIRHPDILYKPLFLSEALCRDRYTGKYLKAIKDSFDSGCDLTYFINYLSDIISGYSMVYIQTSKIVDLSLAQGIDISKSEERAIKVILLFPQIGSQYFDWQKFKTYDQTDFSKQYYNRLLNHLEQKGVLSSRSKGSKLYRLDFEKFGL